MPKRPSPLASDPSAPLGVVLYDPVAVSSVSKWRSSSEGQARSIDRLEDPPQIAVKGVAGLGDNEHLGFPLRWRCASMVGCTIVPSESRLLSSFTSSAGSLVNAQSKNPYWRCASSCERQKLLLRTMIFNHRSASCRRTRLKASFKLVKRWPQAACDTGC